MVKVVEWCRREVGMLFVDLGEDDWGHGDLALKSSLLGGLVIRHLGGDSGGKLGGADEGHDVGVVLKNKDLLVKGSVVVRARSDSDDRARSDMWEFDLEGQGVEYFVGLVF